MSVPGNSAYPPWPGAAPATPLATTARSGLMSKADKATLDANTAEIARLANPARVRVFRSTVQAIPNAAFTAVTFDTARYGSGDVWVAGSPTRLTVPAGQDGIWAFGCACTLAAVAGGAQRQVNIRINGNNSLQIGVQQYPPSATTAPFFVIAGEYAMSAGDYAELVVYQDSGAALNFGLASTVHTYTSDFWGRRESS